MKNIKYLIILVAFISLTACDAYLEDPQPAQSLPSVTAFTTAKDIETGLVGAYNALQQGRSFSCNLLLCSDIMSDNGDWRGSFPSFVEIYNFGVASNNAEISGTWQLSYRAINQANLVLEALTTVQDPLLTTEVANRLKGEALFIRGATLFSTVRYYAKPFGATSGTDLGIPVLTKAVANGSDITFPERATVQAVYTQAIGDLEAAVTLLPTANRGKATKYAALGFLAEIAFQQKDYSKAANFASQVLAGPFSLTAVPADFFTKEGSSEEIWTIVNTTQDNPGVNGSLPTFFNVKGRGGDVVVAPDLVTNGYNKIVTDAQKTAIQGAGFTVEDLRYTTLTAQGNNVRNIEKYEDYVNGADDAPVQRAAAYILMKAEALARTGGINQESVDLLNSIRKRALRVKNASGAVVANSNDFITFKTTDFVDADALIESIILERRIELAFEGNRFHDLMRLGRTVKGNAPDANKLRWPIPQRDLDANNKLKQNPGY